MTDTAPAVTVDAGDESGTLRTVAVAEIRRLIVAGELSSDTSFSESALVERLGMSRAPVREALVVLVQLGWVTSQPRSGYQVAPMTLNELRDLFVVRGLLEPRAAALAAGHRSSGDPEYENLRRFAEDHDDPTGADWADRHYRFHRRITALSRNRELDRAAAEALLKFGRYLQLDSVRKALRVEHGDHRALADAVLAGDPRAAAQTATLHIAEAQAMMTQAIVDTDEIRSATLAPRRHGHDTAEHPRGA